MGSFEMQVKQKAKELKVLFKRGFRFVEHSCKTGWRKVKHIRK